MRHLLERLDDGVVRLDGGTSPIPSRRRPGASARIGIVFQAFQPLYIWSVLDTSRWRRSWSTRSRLSRPRSEALAMDWGRVGLAAAARADSLLAASSSEYDRPGPGQPAAADVAGRGDLGARPRVGRGEVLDLLRELKDDGLTMILNTHEMGFARQVADVVCFLDGGVILEQGRPEQVLGAPAHERTQRFLASDPLSPPDARRGPPYSPGPFTVADGLGRAAPRRAAPDLGLPSAEGEMGH